MRNTKTTPRGRFLRPETRTALLLVYLCALVCLLLCLCLDSCSPGAKAGPALRTKAGREAGCRLRLVSWNVQTFFDAERAGTEYKEFSSSRNWGEQAYRTRLKRLCESLVLLHADVLVLQEIENEAVLHDIGNFLCMQQLPGRRYRWAAFALEEGAALGCAVLSRWPLETLSCHGIDLRSPQAAKPGLRPLLQVRVVKKGRSCTILVNHWKSMSGGREACEYWQGAQEALLASCLKDLPGLPAVACGDFNRDIGEFCREHGGNGEHAGGRIMLRTGAGEAIAVRSPWFLPDGTLAGPGSYYYRESWSRIDGFLYTGTLTLQDFRPETEGPWCYDDTKIPRKYQPWNGRGYSDHLPLSCTIVF